MTGSLQTKKGYFYTVIYVKDASGKTRPKWEATGLTVKGNKRRAQQILSERQAAYERKSVTITKDILFSDFMKEWLDIIQSQVKTNTYHQYSLMVNNSIVPYFEETKISLQDLQPTHIQKYYSRLIKKGLSGNTVKHHHANIHKALNYALRSNWLVYNPADRVELPKREKFIGKAYTAEQLKTLLD